MRTTSSNASDAVMALRGLSARSWLPQQERREPTRPPILLCKENQTSSRPVKQEARPKPSVLKKHPFKVVLRFPELTGGSGLKVLQNASGLLSRALNWIRERQSGRSGGRRLKVTETVSLGEKRFVAVIQVDGNQYLVGGGATNVALLAQLKGNESFNDLLKGTLSVSERQTFKPAIEQMKEQA